MIVMGEPHSWVPWDTNWVPLEYNACKVCSVLGEGRSEGDTCDLTACSSTPSAHGMWWLTFQYHSIRTQGEEIGWPHLRGIYEVLHQVVNWFVPTFQRNYLLPSSGQFLSRRQNKPIIKHGVNTRRFYTGVTVFLYHPVSYLTPWRCSNIQIKKKTNKVLFN